MVYASHKEYRNVWDNAENETPPVPINLDLELASLCQLRCPFCFISDGSFDKMIQQKEPDGKSRRRLMPKELAFRIIDQAAKIGVPALKFNWRGESTLHPDYSEIIQYARKYIIIPGNIAHRTDSFHELLTNTNANCQQHAIDGLMACTKVMVSLDSMIPKTYEIMRRGGDLHLAKETVWKLVVRSHPNIWVRRVLTKDNQGEDFYADVKKEWGDKVKVSEHHCFDRNENQGHQIVDEDSKLLERTYCGYPSQRIIIAASGLAYPCCIDLHQTMPIGDFNKESLLEIWNGDKMQQLRKELKEGIFKSDICKNCVSWMSFKSNKRNFVQDIELKNE